MSSSVLTWGDKFIKYMTNSIHGRDIDNWNAYRLLFPSRSITKEELTKIQLYFPEHYVGDVFGSPPANLSRDKIDSYLYTSLSMRHPNMYGPKNNICEFIEKYRPNLRDGILGTLNSTFDLSKVKARGSLQTDSFIEESIPIVTRPLALIAGHTNLLRLFLEIITKIADANVGRLIDGNESSTIKLQLMLNGVPINLSLDFPELPISDGAQHFAETFFSAGDLSGNKWIINGSLTFTISSKHVEPISWAITELNIIDHVDIATLDSRIVTINRSPVGPDLRALSNNNTETDTCIRRDVLRPHKILTLNGRIVEEIYILLGVMENHDCVDLITSAWQLNEYEGGYYYKTAYGIHVERISRDKICKVLEELGYKIVSKNFIVNTNIILLEVRLYLDYGINSKLVFGRNVYRFNVPAFHILLNAKVCGDILMAVLKNQTPLLRNANTVEPDFITTAEFFRI